MKVRRRLAKIRKAIRSVKKNAALAAGKDPLGLWSLFRYSVDIAVCQKLYGATAADYFKLRFFEKTPRERKTYFTSGDALRFINRVNGEENNRRFWDRNSMYRIMGNSRSGSRSFARRRTAGHLRRSSSGTEKLFSNRRAPLTAAGSRSGRPRIRGSRSFRSGRGAGPARWTSR